MGKSGQLTQFYCYKYDTRNSLLVYFLECLDSPLPNGKQSPRFTFVKQDRYYEGLVQIVLCRKYDILALPNPVHPGHCHCYWCNPDADICRGTAILREGGSQVLTAAYLFVLSPFHVDI